jgi:hypothetical protein
MQKTYSELEYTGKKKRTRRDRFLTDIEQLVPWAQVAPLYFDTTGRRGRPAIGSSRMLRMYVVQQCFGFSDEGTEDAVYDSQAIHAERTQSTYRSSESPTYRQLVEGCGMQPRLSSELLAIAPALEQLGTGGAAKLRAHP